MFEIYRFSQVEIYAFILVLIRISVFLVTWPVFGQRSVPGPVKILLSLLIAFVLFPVVGWRHLDEQVMDHLLLWLSVKEAFIGFIMGYMMRLFFMSIEIAGQVATDAMGLGNARLMGASGDGQSTVIDNFFVILVTMFFLVINGHHIFLGALSQSFAIVPLSFSGLEFLPFRELAMIGGRILEIGVKLGSPVLVAILFTNISMAVVGRAVPQINIFITSLPVNILVGFFVLIITVPLFLTGTNTILEETAARLFGLLKEL